MKKPTTFSPRHGYDLYDRRSCSLSGAGGKKGHEFPGKRSLFLSREFAFRYFRTNDRGHFDTAATTREIVPRVGATKVDEK